MARYAVGDLQGCLTPLQCLLEEVGFDADRDQLWLVGDLVNRGPQSLETLEFLYPLRDRLRIVLGNHDLHALALARGATDQGRHPSLEPLLRSPRLREFMDWLRTLPLCIRGERGDYVMSHAGIAPIWTTSQALDYSAEVSAVLRDDARIDHFLRVMYGNEPARWSDDLAGMDRLRAITNYFTRMRICRADGTLDLSFKGPPEQTPAGLAPWFQWPESRPRAETQLFGHWAALEGKTGRDDCIGLDTGCVWGGRLTLFNLDSRKFHTCDCET